MIIKKYLKDLYKKMLCSSMRTGRKRDIALFGDHFIEENSVPQDNYYMFMYMMESGQDAYTPFYVMHKRCSLYKEAKKKYGSNIIGYDGSNVKLCIRLLSLAKRLKVVCDAYKVFNHTIAGFTEAVKASPFVYVVFTQHGVNFFKEKFISPRSYSAFAFDKITVCNEKEREMFLERGCFQPQNIVNNGLCRWDHIRSEKGSRNIFLFFTHRRYLKELDDIKESVYFKTLVSLISTLNSAPFFRENGCRLKVALHHSVVDKFGYELLDSIDIVRDEEIEEVKSKADLLITDYSSMCFEMWFQHKPVIFLNIPDAEDCLTHDNLTDLIEPYRGKTDRICNICGSAEQCAELLRKYVESGFALTAEDERVCSLSFYYSSDFRKRFEQYLISLKDTEKDWYILPKDCEKYFTGFADLYTTNIGMPNSVGRWTEQRRASVSVGIPWAEGDISVVLRCCPHIVGIQKSLPVKIYVSGTCVLDTVLTRSRSTELRFSVPAKLIKDKKLVLDLSFENILRNGKLFKNDDIRYYGLNLISLKAFSGEEEKIAVTACAQRDIYGRLLSETAKTAEMPLNIPYVSEFFRSDADEADLLKIWGIDDNETFLYAAYLALLHRMPDEDEILRASEDFAVPADQFRESLIKELLSGGEYKDSGRHTANCMIPNAAKALRPAEHKEEGFSAENSDRDSIYLRIYDVMAENSERSGSALEFEREAAALSDSEPCEADLLKLPHMTDNKAFLRLAYIYLLKRFPETGIYESETLFDRPEYSFRKSMICKIVSGREFAGLNIAVRNNIYSAKPALPKTNFSDNAPPSGFMEMLRKIYRRQPEGLRVFEKKLLISLKIIQ